MIEACQDKTLENVAFGSPQKKVNIIILFGNP
jgi:hypothetical protein